MNIRVSTGKVPTYDQWSIVVIVREWITGTEAIFKETLPNILSLWCRRKSDHERTGFWWLEDPRCSPQELQGHSSLSKKWEIQGLSRGWGGALYFQKVPVPLQPPSLATRGAKVSRALSPSVTAVALLGRSNVPPSAVTPLAFPCSAAALFSSPLGFPWPLQLQQNLLFFENTTQLCQFSHLKTWDAPSFQGSIYDPGGSASSLPL